MTIYDGNLFPKWRSSPKVHSVSIPTTAEILPRVCFTETGLPNTTGFYHCGTRFYDANIGRWINADGQIAGIGGDIQGYNLFAYCFNNPVNLDDSTGNWPKLFKSIAKIVKPIYDILVSLENAFSFEIEAGIGVGVKAALNSTEEVEVSVIVFRDRFVYDDSVAEIKNESGIALELQSGEQGIGGGVFYSVDEDAMEKNNETYLNSSSAEWIIDTPQYDQVCLGISGAIYLGIGLGGSVSINLNEFLGLMD